jgi:ribonuclease VapC
MRYAALMVIDAPAIVAILFDEPERARFAAAIDAAAPRLLSAVTFVEATLVVEGRKGPSAERMIDSFVEDGEIEVVPVAIEHVQLACAAFRAFGKRRHPANLNLGDCFAYALAKATGEPLLFKGDDFSKTDIARVA